MIGGRARRIDCFSELASSAFGEKMKEQVEERLRFYDEGIAPQKNITAMQVSPVSEHCLFAERRPQKKGQQHTWAVMLKLRMLLASTTLNALPVIGAD